MPRLLCLPALVAAGCLPLIPRSITAPPTELVRNDGGVLSGIPGSDSWVRVAGWNADARRQSAPSLQYYQLVPGFLPEKKNALGFAVGTGFAQPNPWGAYTAYLMATNARGQRTWRIENYLQMTNFTQGSTMYLLEGSQRALLIDTAQDTPEERGKNDLKTVVRYLLGHNNDGSARSNPVDFVVANTHLHDDHTGKNGQMQDRTVYYPDLDWPASDAPANYVPIREGGGVTPHGSGQAVGEIALGERTIQALNLYGHTPGSMGYLDRENNLIVTGDAIGSGLVWMHFGPLSQYVASLRHLKAVLAPMHDPAILPAHFYQIAMGDRAKPPINGRPLDKAYVDDELAAAEGVLNGSLLGEPYRVVGRNVVVATVRSAGMTYALNRLYPANTRERGYHAIRLPGAVGNPPVPSPVDTIKTDLYLIRGGANNSLYLIKGSAKALLVGTGAGAPGLAGFVGKLAGKVPIEVIVTSDDPGQIGGLSQFAARQIYLPRGSAIARTGLEHVSEVGQGDTIILGTDRAGRPVTIQVEPLAGHSRTGLTLLDVNDRVLLSGDALGTQATDDGLILHDKLADFAASLAAWRARTDGKYDVVYTAHNFQWLTLPAFVDQVQNAVTRGITGGEEAFTDSTAMPGYKRIRSTGAAEVAASIVLAGAGEQTAPSR